MSYENLLNFYNVNKDVLIYGSLRPAKSITRNISSGIMPFISYYRKYKIDSFTEKDIARNILNLDCDGSSTSRDNIRNMQELKFITSADSKMFYHLTNNFKEFCNSGLTVSEYISQDIRKISKLEDITMFYNLILCTLIDGIKNNEIILYPESFDEFKHAVSNEETRKKLCEKVYETYGFKGTANNTFGNYTPNANYRIVSTCVTLHLIERSGQNEYGFKKYSITKTGHSFLKQINDNLA